jgi:hypothetical protein
VAQTFEEAIELEQSRIRETLEKMRDDEFYDTREFKRQGYLHRGIYVEQLEAYFKHFDRSQILIFNSEEMRKNTGEVYRRIQEFLGLPAWQPEKFAPINVGSYSDMKPETRCRLNEYFAPYNQRLYDLLGEDFGWS